MGGGRYSVQDIVAKIDYISTGSKILEFDYWYVAPTNNFGMLVIHLNLVNGEIVEVIDVPLIEECSFVYVVYADIDLCVIKLEL